MAYNWAGFAFIQLFFFTKLFLTKVLPKVVVMSRKLRALAIRKLSIRMKSLDSYISSSSELKIQTGSHNSLLSNPSPFDLMG